MQALLSFLPRFGPVLPGAAMSSLVPKYFGTSADMSGQFGTGAEVSYGHFGTSAEMSWVRSVLGPKCLDTLSVSPGVNTRLNQVTHCVLYAMFMPKCC